MPERMTVAGPVSELRPMSLDRLAAGLGEVAGELLDGRGEDDADEHRDEAEAPAG